MVEIASGNIKARISRRMLDPFTESSGAFLRVWSKKFGRIFRGMRAGIK